MGTGRDMAGGLGIGCIFVAVILGIVAVCAFDVFALGRAWQVLSYARTWWETITAIVTFAGTLVCVIGAIGSNDQSHDFGGRAFLGWVAILQLLLLLFVLAGPAPRPY